MANVPFIDRPLIDPQSDLAQGITAFRDALRAGGGGVPATRTRTSHALTLRAGPKGQIIGACKTYDVQQGRTIDDEFELNMYARGLPRDQVPQSMNTRTAMLERYDLYNRIIEEVFGAEWPILVEQRIPFRIRELWKGPAGLLTGGRRVYELRGCLFESMGRRLSADGERVSLASGMIRFKDRVRLV